MEPVMVKKRIVSATAILAVVGAAVGGAAGGGAHASTYYVNGTCGQDFWSGTSPVCVGPDGPKATFQAAIDATSAGDEVVVADGVYSGIGNRNIRYHGKPITVRSANGPDNCIIDCQGMDGAFNFVEGESSDSVLQAITITNGSRSVGGAIIAGPGPFGSGPASPTIIDCVFIDNSAEVGGAIYHAEGGHLTLGNCTFFGNTAAAGAGAVFSAGDSLTVFGCVFIANTAQAIGALASDHTQTDVFNSVFIQNDGGFVGGGVVSSGPMTLVNCVFSRNTASRGAGVLVATDASFVNCTFSGNSVDGITLEGPTASLANCVLWGNSPQQIGFEVTGGTATVTFSDIQGGWPGTGNINADPLFVQPGTDDLRLSFGSPALDQGSNAALPADVLDLDGDGDTTEPLPLDADRNQRVVNGIVDMGAYEGSFERRDAAATELDLDQGEAVILIPAGGDLDPVVDSAVLVINVSGPDNATFTVTEIPWDLHPDSGGYRDLGMILVTESLLADGEPFMTVMNPFTVSELEGIDPLSLDPIAIDQATGDWMLAVAGNTKNSPGHDTPIGDRIVSVNTTGDWGWTGQLGDYGLYFNPDLQRGFVWAYVDHLGDFGFGSPPCPGDCVPPGGDGLVNVPDLLALLHTWGTVGGGGPCDFDTDGVVNRGDLAVLISAWGLCVPSGQAPLTDRPGGRRLGGVFGRSGPRPRDLDGSGSVGPGDLEILRRAWGRCRRGAPGDLDSNGVVDTRDLLNLLAGWGQAEAIRTSPNNSPQRRPGRRENSGEVKTRP